MVMTDILLEWSQPFSFKDLILNEQLKADYNKSGVYIWISPKKPSSSEMEIAYVGKASGKPSLWARQIQHYKFQISGLYKIPENYFGDLEWNATDEMVEKYFFDFASYSRIAQKG